MTTNEFREEFKILYDNISSNAAPGLNDHEMSVYLTTAQLELVKKAYTGGQSKKGFEGNEKRRRELANLIGTGIVTVFPSVNNEFEGKVVTCSLPSDLLYLVSERVKITSTSACLNGKFLEVIPVTLDELALTEENPFRRSSSRKALRVDSSFTPGSIDLICPETIDKYYVRYIKTPPPIILADLISDPEVGGMGLTINGQTSISTCSLNEGMHREILNRAVELAILNYRENTLANNIQTRIGLDYKED